MFSNSGALSVTDTHLRGIIIVSGTFKLVFDISTRNKISDRLNISNAVIQQALGGLRKKNVIKGITLRETFAVEPEDGVFSLHFKFVVKLPINLPGEGK